MSDSSCPSPGQGCFKSEAHGPHSIMSDSVKGGGASTKKHRKGVNITCDRKKCLRLASQFPSAILSRSSHTNMEDNGVCWRRANIDYTLTRSSLAKSKPSSCAVREPSYFEFHIPSLVRKERLKNRVNRLLVSSFAVLSFITSEPADPH